jgi:acyl-CoA thioesterase
MPAGTGTYRARVDPSWNGPVAPNGGVLAATMLRAAEAELGAGAPPARTISAEFLDAPQTGEAVLKVERLRDGRRVAAAEVRLQQEDRTVCLATIVFSAAREGDRALAEPVQLPPPPPAQAAPPPEFLAQVPPLFAQLEIQPTEGGWIFSDGDRGHTGGWIGFRGDPTPLNSARLCALCDLWWPSVFTALPGPAGVPTLQLTVQLRSTARALPGPVFARFSSDRIQEGHVEERGELWSADGRLLAQSTQLALLLPLN